MKNNQYRIYGNERSSDKLVSYIRDAEYLKDEPLGYWSRPDTYQYINYLITFNEFGLQIIFFKFFFK